MARHNRNHRLQPLPEPEELTTEEQSDVLTFLRGIDARMNTGSGVGLDESEARHVVHTTAKRLHRRPRKQR